MNITHDKAIRTLYPNVKVVDYQDDYVQAYDENGNIVDLDSTVITSWIDPESYKTKRAAEYPSIAEQLDTLYHGGLTEWKATIKAVKDKYPKE